MKAPDRMVYHRDIAFAALTETSPEGIVTMDSDRRIVSANRAMEQLFGFTSDEIAGRPLAALIPEESSAPQQATEYVEPGVPSLPWTGLRRVALTKHRGPVPVEITIGTFFDGGRRFFSGFIRDISERVRHEQELEVIREAHAVEAAAALRLSERHRADAEAALRSRDDVLSVVAHDLRNPLNTIVMSATLLLAPDVHMNDADSHHLVDIINRSAHRMNRLIQDLLDVGRIETGRFSVDRQLVNAADIIREVCEEFAGTVAQRGQILECTVAEPTIAVRADRGRVMQLLSNYLNNAVKFTPRGGRINIGLSVDSDGGVRFSVADSGPGIDPADLQHIFDGFWQAERTAHLGAGLGLAIARGIAAAHGGRVWAESTVGDGSSFYFRIPAETPG